MAFPTIQPYRQHRFRVSELHEIYVEECGNPEGTPALFVHGGPGGGCEPWHRQFFDPKRYRIILFDQRGCGRSTPHAELRENTTWDLVNDMEGIRERLGIERWLLFGGSWGSTLSLAYAQAHPRRVTAMVLRGIFLLRKKEVQWFYQEGASWFYPDAWEHFIAPIPPDERQDLVAAYHKRLTSNDDAIRIEAARAWSVWEGSTSKLIPRTELVSRFAADRFAEAFARIECHYFVNQGFFESDNQLLENAHRLQNIPMTIVHGRYDVVCPLNSAWELHRALPSAEFHVVSDAGHAASEPGIYKRLLGALDRYSSLR